MSNVLAIAATTRALRNLLLARIPVLDAELADLEVSLQPPDLARKGISKTQLNLFLFQVVINTAWRNQDMPRQVRSGETAPPALALTLHYLITSWGRGDSDSEALSHRVLAAAMSTLHDHPLLDRDDITNALPDNDLATQVERVRLTPLPQSVEELSKLWTAFQTSYRVSAAYEATVVLIDSHGTARAPLPVLRRGAQDRGVFTTASAAPVLDALAYPRSQTAARLGEAVLLSGRQLGTDHTVVRFTSPRLDAPIDLTPLVAGAAGTLQVEIADTGVDADAVARWAPGLYSVALLQQLPDLPALLSNELPLALAPSITLGALTAATGDINLEVSCVPRIREGQRVFLLFGDRLLVLQSMSNPIDTHQPSALVFQIPGVSAGIYTVRLRVDGVDSIPVDFSGSGAVFDPQQQVVVT